MMAHELIDWKSPEVESATFLVFFQLLVFFLGLFGWVRMHVCFDTATILMASEAGMLF